MPKKKVVKLTVSGGNFKIERFIHSSRKDLGFPQKKPTRVKISHKKKRGYINERESRNE